MINRMLEEIPAEHARESLDAVERARLARGMGALEPHAAAARLRGWARQADKGRSAPAPTASRDPRALAAIGIKVKRVPRIKAD